MLALAIVVAACSDGPARVVVPDTTAPRVRIVFPTAPWPFGVPTAWDRDSNGLIEIEVAWSDSGGAINPQSVRLWSLDGVPGAPSDTNLARGWRHVRLDSAGMVFEETIPLLLRSGLSRLVAEVADTAGNVGADTFQVGVPPGAFHREIDLAYQPQWPQVRGVNLALSADGSRGVAPFQNGRVALFATDGSQSTNWLESVPNVGFAIQVSADSASGRAYLGGFGSPGVSLVDIASGTLAGSPSLAVSVASVHVAAGRLLAGEYCTDGSIRVYDQATLAPFGRVSVGAVTVSGACPNATRFAVAVDRRTAWANVQENGIVRFDLQSLTVQQRLDIRAPIGDGDYGHGRDIKLGGDRWLYVTRLGEGLDEIDTQTGLSVAHYPSSGPANARELALSPNGRVLFVTWSPPAGTSVRAPLLFDVPGLRLRYAFPERPGAIHDAAAFHPDGKRVFVMAEYKVDVYLVRPD